VNREGRFSSHLSLLIRALTLSDGPVLELGMGMFSTPVLHWMCFPRRRLLSFESDRRYFEKLRGFADPWFHEIYLAEDWDAIPIEQPWDVVLVDHNAGRRRVELPRVRAAKFVVIHDTDAGRPERVYQMSAVIAQYYRYAYQLCVPGAPSTTVASNTVDNLKEMFA
jgi:hypothetical protein